MASFERIKTNVDKMLHLVNVENIVSIHHEEGKKEVLIYSNDTSEEKYAFDTPENAREWVMKMLRDY